MTQMEQIMSTHTVLSWIFYLKIQFHNVQFVTMEKLPSISYPKFSSF